MSRPPPSPSPIHQKESLNVGNYCNNRSGCSRSGGRYSGRRYNGCQSCEMPTEFACRPMYSCETERRDNCSCESSRHNSCDCATARHDTCGCETVYRDTCGCEITRRDTAGCDAICQAPVIASSCPGQVVGMAYVPYQTFAEVYDVTYGFTAGTLFPELDKPFKGGRCVR